LIGGMSGSCLSLSVAASAVPFDDDEACPEAMKQNQGGDQ
jgi:hypothetical protein